MPRFVAIYISIMGLLPVAAIVGATLSTKSPLVMLFCIPLTFVAYAVFVIPLYKGGSYGRPS